MADEQAPKGKMFALIKYVDSDVPVRVTTVSLHDDVADYDPESPSKEYFVNYRNEHHKETIQKPALVLATSESQEYLMELPHEKDFRGKMKIKRNESDVAIDIRKRMMKKGKGKNMVKDNSNEPEDDVSDESERCSDDETDEEYVKKKKRLEEKILNKKKNAISTGTDSTEICTDEEESDDAAMKNKNKSKKGKKKKKKVQERRRARKPRVLNSDDERYLDKKVNLNKTNLNFGDNDVIEAGPDNFKTLWLETQDREKKLILEMEELRKKLQEKSEIRSLATDTESTKNRDQVDTDGHEMDHPQIRSIGAENRWAARRSLDFGSTSASVDGVDLVPILSGDIVDPNPVVQDNIINPASTDTIRTETSTRRFPSLVVPSTSRKRNLSLSEEDSKKSTSSKPKKKKKNSKNKKEHKKKRSKKSKKSKKAMKSRTLKIRKKDKRKRVGDFDSKQIEEFRKIPDKIPFTAYPATNEFGENDPQFHLECGVQILEKSWNEMKKMRDPQKFLRKLITTAIPPEILGTKCWSIEQSHGSPIYGRGPRTPVTPQKLCGLKLAFIKYLNDRVEANKLSTQDRDMHLGNFGKIFQSAIGTYYQAEKKKGVERMQEELLKKELEEKELRRAQRKEQRQARKDERTRGRGRRERSSSRSVSGSDSSSEDSARSEKSRGPTRGPPVAATGAPSVACNAFPSCAQRGSGWAAQPSGFLKLFIFYR